VECQSQVSDAYEDIWRANRVPIQLLSEEEVRAGFVQ
jgi:hypothetical protein